MTENGNAPSIGPFSGFGADVLEFYEDLAADNSRSYWQAHKSVYTEQIAEPLRALAHELEPEFGPVKIFRPYRDVRFRADKRPYQEHASLAAGTEATGNVYYFQVSPDGVLFAGGMYEPARDQLQRFRELQDDDARAAELDRLLASLRERGLELWDDDRLRTAPRGWPRDHPRLSLLQLRHLAVGRGEEPGEWLHTAACRAHIEDTWRQIRPWNEWLERAVGASDEPRRPRGG